MKDNQNKQLFLGADLLIPKTEYLNHWSVVACDQYSSNPAYWNRVKETTEGHPSSLNVIMPEAWLNTKEGQAHLDSIAQNMESYLEDEIFETYPNAFVYVQRTLNDGSIRTGLIGKLDLEAYDFHQGSTSMVRATEATIEERIPPRMAIRAAAPLEFPHVLLLADDEEDMLLEPFKELHETLPKLYDFDLMENGGHITGWLVDGNSALAFLDRMESYISSIPYKYRDLNEKNLVFAVGDGNHSLASAKALWEQIKEGLSEEEQENHPARYALVEIENIHDDSQKFEPIHRIVTNTDPYSLLEMLQSECAADEGYPISWIIHDQEGSFCLDPKKGELACAILQNFLDAWMKEHGGSIDFIHEDQELKNLAYQQDAIGFLLPAIDKKSLFRGVIADGSLPRKTFSMGHANEKRYYLEGKKIRP